MGGTGHSVFLSYATGGLRCATTVHRPDRYSIGLETMARPVQIAQFLQLVWLNRASVRLAGSEIGGPHNKHGNARGEHSYGGDRHDGLAARTEGGNTVQLRNKS